MNPGRIVRYLLLGVVFGNVMFAADDPAAPLLGRWRSTSTSNGGIGSILIFGPGGMLRSSPGAVVDATYRVEGDTLVLPPATSSGPEQRQMLVWVNNDRVRLADAELTRRSLHASTQTIVGEWTSPRDMGGISLEATYIFRADGSMLLVIPFRFEQGSYSFKGRSFSLTLPNRPAAATSFSLKDDVLALTIEGQTANFRRY